MEEMDVILKRNVSLLQLYFRANPRKNLRILALREGITRGLEEAREITKAFLKKLTGEYSLSLEEISLKDILHLVEDRVEDINNANLAAKEGGKKVLELESVEDRAGIDSVMADRFGLSRIITNLLGNAAIYKRPEAPLTKIKIVLTAKLSFLQISIKDDGRGLSETDLRSLFRAQHRAKSVIKELIPGTGLGLNYCLGIVEAHGGRIWAESEGPGKGATFHFTLPLSAPEG